MLAAVPALPHSTDDASAPTVLSTFPVSLKLYDLVDPNGHPIPLFAMTLRDFVIELEALRKAIKKGKIMPLLPSESISADHSAKFNPLIASTAYVKRIAASIEDLGFFKGMEHVIKLTGYVLQFIQKVLNAQLPGGKGLDLERRLGVGTYAHFYQGYEEGLAMVRAGGRVGTSVKRQPRVVSVELPADLLSTLAATPGALRPSTESRCAVPEIVSRENVAAARTKPLVFRLDQRLVSASKRKSVVPAAPTAAETETSVEMHANGGYADECTGEATTAALIDLSPILAAAAADLPTTSKLPRANASVSDLTSAFKVNESVTHIVMDMPADQVATFLPEGLSFDSQKGASSGSVRDVSVPRSGGFTPSSSISSLGNQNTLLDSDTEVFEGENEGVMNVVRARVVSKLAPAVLSSRIVAKAAAIDGVPEAEAVVGALRTAWWGNETFSEAKKEKTNRSCGGGFFSRFGAAVRRLI